MNKIFTRFFLLVLSVFLYSTISAQCPSGTIKLNTQSEVDDFATDYPDCFPTMPAATILLVEGSTITNLNGLSVLKQIDGELTIEKSDLLSDINGLMNLMTVGGQLQFEDCPLIVNLNALSSLTSCHDLEIQGMEGLTSLSGLSGLMTLSGDLHIKDCDALTSLTGLEGITSIGGYLQIDQNKNLTSLDGLDNITSIGDNLRIGDDNLNLNDLTALSKLTSVGGSVKILKNKNLETLDGLENITSIGGGIDVKNNESLYDCIGICKMLDALLPGENAHFSNNFPGTPCNHLPTLEAECLIALPVELTSFKGFVMERSNMLKWQTESEENSMVFLVERSLDGKTDFSEIGRVNAFGNSTTFRNYEMEDGNPVSLAYYRLRMVDFDGTFEYSDVIAVERSKTEIDLVEVYPIPAEDEVTVLVHAKTAGKAIVTLSDFMGRKIFEEKVGLKAGINRYNFNWQDHETNFYYLTIYNGNERIAKKILKASRD